MLDFDEEEFICVMTDGDNKRPGCFWLVMVFGVIVLTVGFLAMF